MTTITIRRIILGTLYELHPNPREPAANAFEHLNAWLDYLEKCNHQVTDSDFLYPHIQADRVTYGVQMQQPKVCLQVLCYSAAIPF